MSSTEQAQVQIQIAIGATILLLIIGAAAWWWLGDAPWQRRSGPPRPSQDEATSSGGERPATDDGHPTANGEGLTTGDAPGGVARPSPSPATPSPGPVDPPLADAVPPRVVFQPLPPGAKDPVRALTERYTVDEIRLLAVLGRRKLPLDDRLRDIFARVRRGDDPAMILAALPAIYREASLPERQALAPLRTWLRELAGLPEPVEDPDDDDPPVVEPLVPVRGGSTGGP